MTHTKPRREYLTFGAVMLECQIESGVIIIDTEKELFQKMYYSLFSATADAVELLEQGKSREARNRLIQAERDTEEMYMSGRTTHKAAGWT